MGSLPLHPALVHLPMGLAMVIPLIAIGITWAVWRGKLGRAGWAVVVALQLLLVGGAFVALQTGEGEEERVESVVPESAIEAHEEAAQAFLIAGGAVLVIAALGLFRSEKLRRYAAVAGTVGSLAVLGLGYRVGHLGGELVYTHGAGSVTASQTAGATHLQAHADDD